jgi:hypothetical protein
MASDDDNDHSIAPTSSTTQNILYACDDVAKICLWYLSSVGCKLMDVAPRDICGFGELDQIRSRYK